MKQSVLFVDDDVSLLTGLKRMLHSNREEWDLTFVEDPVKAVKAMQQTCFDVVVTDMRMPGLDGAQLLNEVRHLCPHSLRIILSGQAELATVLRAVEHAHRYVTKPCNAEFLKETIREVCKLQAAPFAREVKQALSQLKCLPIHEKSLNELFGLLNDQNCSVEAVAELIAKDLGMASKIMQLVNSAFFTSTETPNYKDAVKVLGIDLLRKLTLEADIFSPSLTDSGWIPAINNFFFKYSSNHNCAGQSESKIDSELFFRGAGILALFTIFPEQFDKFVHTVDEYLDDKELIPLQRELFGATQAEVGSFLLELWGFDKKVVSVAAAYTPSVDEVLRVLSLKSDELLSQPSTAER